MAYQGSAPVLSTELTHVFDTKADEVGADDKRPLSDEQIHITYEIRRTILDIRAAKYKRVALQFPDPMLQDAPRVFKALEHGLRDHLNEDRLNDEGTQDGFNTDNSTDSQPMAPTKLFILGDTSYGACCVDEIAAEHVDADAVVHYGRACLSPTTRLPVIYVFTSQTVPMIDQLCRGFEKVCPEKDKKVILMADVTYQNHLHHIAQSMADLGYSQIFETEVRCDASSPLPNRSIPKEVITQPSLLKEWHLFHIATPPDSLLLTLSTRLASIYTQPTESLLSTAPEEPTEASMSRAISRRYALLTSVSTESIFGILINTLSVKHFLHMVDHVKKQITAAGKKSYTFVVGKLNAAKVANFSEIGAWVVIGCWESSLIDSKDFWRPVITPFELVMALKPDEERIWTGEWSSDYQQTLQDPEVVQASDTVTNRKSPPEADLDGGESNYIDSESDSQPPEYDLRTGKYVSTTRPMHPSPQPMVNGTQRSVRQSMALSRRTRHDLAVVGGQSSPGADFLKTQRTWRGLGSDLELEYEEVGTVIQEGRRGIPRGYVLDGHVL